MRRAFKTRVFNRWMRRAELSDAALCKAILEMEKGLIDADLGGHVVKKRIALAGRGKSGGARTLVATNFRGRWFFLFGFEKNERDNIGRDDLSALQETAKTLLGLHDQQIKAAVEDGALMEICNDDKA